MNSKKIFSIFMLTLLSLSIIPAVFAVALPVGLSVDWIKVDGDIVQPGDSFTFNRGESVPVRIKLTANTDVKNAQITVGIFGYEYAKFESDKVIKTDLIDLRAGKTDTIDFTLEIPTKITVDDPAQDTQLNIFIANRYDTPLTYQYNLFIDGVDNSDAVIVKEAYLSPSNQVLAGRAVSALVRVENIGRDDLIDGVTLLVRVPQLGIQDTETLDTLNADKVKTFEKIILRFPKDTPAGDYVVEYTLRYDSYYSTTVNGLVTVIAAAQVETIPVEPKTFITVPSAQSAVAGANGAVFPILISNTDTSAKTYTVIVSGVNGWGTARVDQGTALVVDAGQSASAFVFVDVNQDTQAGERAFTVSVSSQGDQKVIPLSVIVSQGNNKSTAGSFDSLKKVLEIGLIIVVIILILIGLIVGFNKLRGNDDDDDDSKTYY